MNSNRHQNLRRRPFSHQITDRRLLPRIEQFIIQGCRGRVPGAEEIADHLCTMYPEYRRKKRNWFVSTVVKALSIIRLNQYNEGARLQDLEQRYMPHRMGLPANQIGEGDLWNDLDSSESDVEILDAKEPLVEVKDSNGVNKSMHQMYARSARESTSESPGRGQPRVKNTPMRNDLTHIEREVNSSSQSPRKSDVLPEGSAGNQAPFQDVGHQEEKKNTSNSQFMDERKSNESDTFIEIIDVSASPPNNKHPVKGTMSNSVSKAAGEEREIKRRSLKRKAEPKKKAEEEEGPPMARSTVTFEDIGGCEGCLEEISKLILHMKHPEVFHQLGVEPPRGFLLHGPPGCGKTLLANAIAGELGLPFYKVAATEMVSGVSGESEEKIRNLFSEAKARSPSILFFDEIDAITPKRETVSREMERRIVSQLLFCLDDLVNSEAHVLVIGATNRPDALDPALRRAGRFDREICMGIPDRKARAKILKIQCRSLRLEDPFDYEHVAALTPGFVGADLMALTREAAMCAVDRVFKDVQPDPMTTGDSTAMESDTRDKEEEAKRTRGGFPTLTEARRMVTSEPPLTEEQLSTLYIEVRDFQTALPLVQPSAKREGFATIPDVTWDDIGALEDIKEELSMAVLAPVKHQEQFEALGLASPPGILLAGPPGCGKTLLAKAVANEGGINFISVKGPELLNMYVGESERAVRQVFQRARNSAPCVIFFDEIDALCPKRSDMAESSASSRVVNQLLTEMDGLEVRKQVFLMGATNRPDIIDPAILRPGRLDKRLYVGLPGKEDREKILTKITKGGTKPTLDKEVDLLEVAADERCERFSGADLAALVRESSTNAIREYFKATQSVSGQGLQVKKRHFEAAFAKVKPSVSTKDQLWYQEMVKMMNS